MQTQYKALKGFIGLAQVRALGDCLAGEESEYFDTMLIALATRIDTMPTTYEQDGKGENAIAYLHYFNGSCDWYITEKDVDHDGAGQIQAFGQADLGYGEPELGYISITELLDNGVELDLYFTPSTLGQINVKVKT